LPWLARRTDALPLCGNNRSVKCINGGLGSATQIKPLMSTLYRKRKIRFLDWNVARFVEAKKPAFDVSCFVNVSAYCKTPLRSAASSSDHRDLLSRHGTSKCYS
jgi:hypothetical protein